MKPYWYDYFTPHPGLRIQEVENKYDNVYIKDEWGRVWQVWINQDCPVIQLVGRE